MKFARMPWRSLSVKGALRLLSVAVLVLASYWVAAARRATFAPLRLEEVERMFPEFVVRGARYEPLAADRDVGAFSFAFVGPGGGPAPAGVTSAAERAGWSVVRNGAMRTTVTRRTAGRHGRKFVQQATVEQDGGRVEVGIWPPREWTGPGR